MPPRVAPFALLIVAGCSVLSLENLQGAGGEPSGTVGGSGGSPSSSTTGDATTSSASSSTSSSASTGGGGQGAGGGATSTATTSSVSSTSSGETTSTSAGGGCPEFCAGVDAVLCDSFDGPSPLDAWSEVVFQTSDPLFEVVSDPTFSCPAAVAVQYFGPTDPFTGGWAELERRVRGQPGGLVFSTRVFREETGGGGMEGVLETIWSRSELSCVMQVQISTSPPAAQFQVAQYDLAGNGLEIAGGYVSLAVPTFRAWLDVEIEVKIGARGFARLRVGDDEVTDLLDEEGVAACDDALDVDSARLLIGAPYNQLPTRLVYDDVVVVTK